MNDTATCPMCGSATRRVLDGRPDHEYGHPTRLAYHRCRADACGFVFADPVPADQIAGFYADYSTHASPQAAAPAGAIARLTSLLTPPSVRREQENYFGAWIPQDPDLRILDFGCGNGRLLKRLRERGFRDLHGFDFDPKARAAARRQDYVIHDRIDELQAAGQAFDVVVLNHVIEHLDDPVGIARQLIALLRPGGVLYLRTPNTASVLSRLFGADWRGYETPRHLNLFNPRSVRFLVERLPAVSAEIRTENGLLQGMFHESFVAARWKSPAGRALRHLCFPLVAWACVGINAILGTVGEELVVRLRKLEPGTAADEVQTGGPVSTVSRSIRSR